MNVDTIGRVVTVTRAELRNHQTYLKVKERMNSGYALALLDPPARKPWNALVVRKAELRDVQAYEAAKQRANEEHRALWIEDEEDEGATRIPTSSGPRAAAVTRD
jgi:hypothetical protein